MAENEEVFEEIRLAMLEVGRGLKNHLKRNSERKKAREKFELVNIILPEIAKKSSQLLSKEEPDLAPIITKIMNAVFCEEEIGWNKERKLATCKITVFNYTARARAYTILAKWPEGEESKMIENPGGRKEAKGIWAWRLDTLNPGTSAEISFMVSGLTKGEWVETDIFFRGNGDIIGATRIDEKLLEEMRKSESLEAVELEIDDVNKQSKRDNEITKEAELESTIKSNLEEGQRTLFDSYGVVE